MSREPKEKYTVRLRKRDLNTLRFLSHTNDKPIANYLDNALEELFTKLGIDPNDYKDWEQH
ncbi:hypothetical protein [Vibrio owensii]|uniref:hypothetical protein n=1 Tax=Vibrio owensii TaxID=696485 RepID=UPI0012D41F61|nr:hypothetical protein [Vibrio owensii]